MNRSDLARDCSVTPVDGVSSDEFKFEADWQKHVCRDILKTFVNPSPSYISEFKVKNSNSCHIIESEIRRIENKKGKRNEEDKAWLKFLKTHNIKGQNPLFADYNYVARCVQARSDVFYVKHCHAPQPDNHLLGAHLRFEHRMFKRKEIENAIGTSTLAGLHDLLLEVKQWHDGGRKGELPLLEQVLDARLERWNKPSSQAVRCAKSKFFPKPTKNLIALLLALEEAIYTNQRHLLITENYFQGSRSTARHQENLQWIQDNIKVRRPLELEEKEWILATLNLAFDVLKPTTVHQIAGRVTGYLNEDNEVSQEKNARKPYDRLMGLVEFFCDFYGGDFLGTSQLEQRRAIIKHLKMGSHRN